MRKTILFFLLLTGYVLQAQVEKYIFVDRIEISKNIKQQGVSGINIKATIKLKDIPLAMDTTQWYVFAEIRNDNNRLIYTPQLMPEVYKTVAPKGEYIRLPIIKNHLLQYDFFIPYRRIMEDPGLNNYTFNLVVCDRYKRVVSPPIASQSATIQIPQGYVMKIDLEKADVIRGEYDEAGKKIPFLGLFLSGNSKSGKGRPDIVWNIQVGNEYVFESEEATNEFSAKKGSASFRISDTDPVKLSIVDNDDFSTDELIGEYFIQHSSGEYQQNINGLSFGKVIHADFSVSKVAIPVINDISLSVSEASYQGVSGIYLDIAQSTQTDKQLSIRPIFTNSTFTSIQVPRFVKFVSGKLIPVSSGMIGVSQEHDTSVRLFIPHYAVLPNMFPAVQYYLEGYGLLLKQVKSDLKFSRKEVHDVKIKMISREAVVVKGIHGIKLVIGIDVPEMYYDDLSPLDISYALRFTDNQGNDLTSWLSLLTSIRRFEFSKFELIRPQKEVVFFIPYYKMQLASPLLQVVAQIKSTLREPAVQLGEYSQSFTYDAPVLIQVPNLRIEATNKNRVIDKYYFRFYHGPQLLANSDTIVNGKAVFYIPSKGWNVYHEDEVLFELVGIDFFGTEQVVGRWQTKADIFLSKKPVILPGVGKGVKKAKIRFD
ncbi:MAG: hypothetical protein N2167_03880 [Flavobacteriales bacterium]|nr:hypothetical protein [Flavobacteriales bacterium]